MWGSHGASVGYIVVYNYQLIPIFPHQDTITYPDIWGGRVCNETSVYIYQTTRHHIPENSNLGLKVVYIVWPYFLFIYFNIALPSASRSSKWFISSYSWFSQWTVRTKRRLLEYFSCTFELNERTWFGGGWRPCAVNCTVELQWRFTWWQCVCWRVSARHLADMFWRNLKFPSSGYNFRLLRLVYTPALACVCNPRLACVYIQHLPVFILQH